jgi:predicted O-methyltransferase YrrM
MSTKQKQIDRYIIDHSSGEDDLLKELTRQTHLQVLRPRMLSGPVQGQMLYLLCRMMQPRRILEIGTYTGYSAICMARGMAESGELVTIEINDELRSFADSFFKKAGLQTVITQLTGSALNIIPELEGEFDLVFVDGDKREYPEYYKLVFDKVRAGGFILADNVLWDGKVVEPLHPNDDYTKGILDFNEMVKQDSRVEKVILPIRDGLTLIRKIGN